MIDKRRERVFYLSVFLLPCLIYIFFWKIGPLFYTVALSFTEFNYVTQSMPRFVGIENYRRLILDSTFRHSLGIAFFFMAVVTFIELMAGLGLAILFDRPLKAKNVLTGILLIPMILVPVVVGVIWYILYSDMVGPISQFLKYIGFPRPQWTRSQSTALFSIILADIWQWTPFMFLLMLSALQVIPVQLVESAKIDGASGFKIFRYITLPLITDVMLIAAILRSMDAFREFDKIWVMTRGGPGTATDIASIRVYKTAFQYFEIGYAAAMVVLLLIIISSIYLYYLRLEKR
ncbi:Trehalose transport system permease protein SugA [subsurface metagenome]